MREPVVDMKWVKKNYPHACLESRKKILYWLTPPLDYRSLEAQAKIEKYLGLPPSSAMTGRLFFERNGGHLIPYVVTGFKPEPSRHGTMLVSTRSISKSGSLYRFDADNRRIHVLVARAILADKYTLHLFKRWIFSVHPNSKETYEKWWEGRKDAGNWNGWKVL